MIEVSKMGSELVSALAEHKLSCEDVAVFAALDMDLDRSRADVYLVLTEKELLVLTGQTSSSGKP
ncbi:MAG: hypothetical protein IKN36_02680, partial [Clostridia bacterium]|nr:hypothetical protein [Clostridia bacterium]